MRYYYLQVHKQILTTLVGLCHKGEVALVLLNMGKEGER